MQFKGFCKAAEYSWEGDWQEGGGEEADEGGEGNRKETVEDEYNNTEYYQGSNDYEDESCSDE